MYIDHTDFLNMIDKKLTSEEMYFRARWYSKWYGIRKAQAHEDNHLIMVDPNTSKTITMKYTTLGRYIRDIFSKSISDIDNHFLHISSSVDYDQTWGTTDIVICECRERRSKTSTFYYIDAQILLTILHQVLSEKISIAIKNNIAPTLYPIQRFEFGIPIQILQDAGAIAAIDIVDWKDESFSIQTSSLWIPKSIKTIDHVQLLQHWSIDPNYKKPQWKEFSLRQAYMDQSKPIIVYVDSGKTAPFPSIVGAARSLGIKEDTLRKVLSGQIKTTKVHGDRKMTAVYATDTMSPEDIMKRFLIHRGRPRKNNNLAV